MKNFVLKCLVIIMFMSAALCYGIEEKKHICFRVIDADKDGKVTFQEFKKFFGDEKAKFDAIDLNNDGKLSHAEYHKSLGHGAL